MNCSFVPTGKELDGKPELVCSLCGHTRATTTLPEKIARECVSRGLGDTVAKAIHTVTGGLVKPCGGCKERQEKLNKLLPYGDTADDGRSG